MTTEQEAYLEQPEYSNFINAMIEQCGDDPDNGHFFNTLLSLELVDIHGEPTALAKQVGLPDHNQELLSKIAKVAVCKHAKETREDWLISARHILSKTATDELTEPSIEELRKMVRRTATDISDWQADQVKAMNEALNIIGK